jgi:tRNA (guanine-N7-)-methyltransferase
MKPKDLKHPFRWDERRVLLEDHVLYVPDYYQEYETFRFPGWESEEIFGNSQPVHVEFCSGNGSWIASKAEAQPEINWVAVEMRFDRVRKIWSKIKNKGLKNLFVVSGEAITTSRHFFPAQSVSCLHVNFPDPWPKKRHAKHRIIQEPFAREAERLLLDGGQVVLVTDDPNYSTQMLEVMAEAEAFAPLLASGPCSSELPGYGTSFFEELWRRKGCEIRYHQYKRLERQKEALA